MGDKTECNTIECLEPSDEIKQEIMARAMDRCEMWKDSRGDYGMCLSHETGGMFYHWRLEQAEKTKGKDEIMKKL